MLLLVYLGLWYQHLNFVLFQVWIFCCPSQINCRNIVDQLFSSSPCSCTRPLCCSSEDQCCSNGLNYCSRERNCCPNLPRCSSNPVNQCNVGCSNETSCSSNRDNQGNSGCCLPFCKRSRRNQKADTTDAINMTETNTLHNTNVTEIC